jgi:hypothetical protein
MSNKKRINKKIKQLNVLSGKIESDWVKFLLVFKCISQRMNNFYPIGGFVSGPRHDPEKIIDKNGNEKYISPKNQQYKPISLDLTK